MANIVHVGLVKTATTSLQKYVFSEIPKIRPKVIFNASNLIRYIDLFKLGFLEEENLRILRKCLAEQNHFISRESLVGWNPRSWRRNADENLELFGPDATIIITVRKTESFLRSVYQQTIHEGNVRHAENFFLNAKNYDAVKPFFSEYESSWFDVDSYDLRILEGIYRERFKKIIFVSLSDLKELRFLRDIFDLTPIEHAQLCRKLEFGKKMNRAYSQQAMNLTFLRSRLLRKLSLEIRGSDARVYERALMLKKNHIVKPYKNLNVKEKILNFIPRVINKILHLISWRNLMQNNFINLFFRTRYSLPPSIYRNHELAKNNDKFVEEISKYY